MSVYGAIIYNKDDKIIIDSQYRNFRFVEDGSVTVKSYMPYFPTTVPKYCNGTTLVVATDLIMDPFGYSEGVLVAFKPNTDFGVAPVGADIQQVYIDGSWQYVVNRLWFLGDLDDYSSAQTMDIRIFRGNENVATDPDVGIIIQNASENSVFKSNEKYLNIIAIYEATIPWNGDNSTSKNVTVQDADNNYFFITPIGANVTAVRFGDYDSKAHNCGLKKINSTTVQLRDIAVSYHFWGDGTPSGTGATYWRSPVYIYEIDQDLLK